MNGVPGTAFQPRRFLPGRWPADTRNGPSPSCRHAAWSPGIAAARAGARVVIVLACLCPPTHAATSCDIHAFSLDPETAIEVRSGPGNDFASIATVPADPGRTVFAVVEHSGEWTRVVHAVDSRGSEAFTGSGWVPAVKLAVRPPRKYKVHQRAGRTSETIDISLFAIDLPLAGCREDWVEVELPVTGTAIDNPVLRGWMPPGSACGNPWTGCD